MPLESLLELVETLRKRIDEHGAALRQSEALTRYALIDPLLRGLGWDTGDPALIIPEYRSSAGSADYALMSSGSQAPVLIIEAKKLGEPLDDRVALQSLNYCNLIGTPHFTLTDGKTWKIYATFEHAPLADRLIATFTIGEMAAAQVCLQAMALWRPSVEVSNVSAAQPPVVELDTAAGLRNVASAMKEPSDAAPPQIPVAQMQPSSADSSGKGGAQEGIPLPEVSAQPRSKLAEIQFPDNSRVQIRNWVSLTAETVRWLLSRGMLNDNHYPIQQGRRYTVASSPVHSNGKKFAQLHQVGHLYIEGNYSSEHHLRNSITIIQRVGLDPAQFKVRLAP